MAESGFADFVSAQWFAAAAPAGTPDEIVALLSRKIGEALRNPAIAQKLANVGVEVLGSTPQEMAKFVAEETARWHKVINDAGLQPG
jgi:tripartite-type tricarboxylate transporter receptor subunit TctC